MKPLNRIQTELFNPLYPVLLYLFLSITTLHMQVPFLLSIHLEALALIWALVTSFMLYIFAEGFSLNYKNIFLISLLIGLLFISAPILTSFATGDQLSVFGDDEFKTLFEMILFAPCVLQVMKQERNREIIIDCFIAFYTLFAVYFLYRYLILHEVRNFDLRPQLKIRHGDANFLCTFFSMMIPLSLMKAWEDYKQKKKLKIFVNLFSSLLLFICVLLTQSRMGIIATFLGLLYLFTRSYFGISKKYLLAPLLACLVLIGISGQSLSKRFVEIQDKSNSDRYLTWKNGFQVFSEYPLFGTGIHKAKTYFYQNTGYPHFQSEMHALEVHNTFLKTLAELGLVGFVLFCLLFFWPWKKVFQVKSGQRFFLMSSMIILTLSILTIGLTYKDLFILHLFLIAGLALFYSEDNASRTIEN